jgi:phosphatidylserine/phosphatidylglycerophosphate/cardiolipin synthase-like enzyme
MRSLAFLALGISVFLLLAAPLLPGATSEAAPLPGANAVPAPPPLQLVESFPVETDLDHSDIPDAHDVWIAMIHGAGETLDFAEFYASNEPASRLEEVVREIERAAERGVRVRFLGDEGFAQTYPETLARLAGRPHVTVRRFDVRARMGGVLHAKYFLVDHQEAFLGSQNFDWRALTHIQELGVRIREPRLVAALQDVFEMDWALAAGEEPASPREPAEDRTGLFPLSLLCEGDTVRVTPAFSPRDWLPDESLWDLPQIVRLIDTAEKSVRVQLLSYRAVGRDGSYFDDLESALRRAAARGVEVRLLLADWCKRAGTIEGLQSLEPLPGIEVRLVTIPPWSGGPIPYARVIHAKYLVVDGRRAWLGTSNWEKSYFHTSRNVGLVIEGGRIPAHLDRFFLDGWESPYASPVDPCAVYEPPVIDAVRR